MPSGTRAQNGRRIVTAILVLVGTPLYVVCGLRHICMDGHMGHPPYPWPDLANDGVWLSCFATAAVFSIRSNLRLRRTLSVLLILLGLSRLLAGSAGGGFFPLELLFLAIVTAIAVTGLIAPARDWSMASSEERTRHRRTVIRAAIAIALAPVILGATGWGGWRLYRFVRQARAPVVQVPASSVAFVHEAALSEGEALRIILPNGKEVAVWCEAPSAMLAQTRPRLNWGERPFEQLDLSWVQLPDGGQVADEWISYIRQGVVRTWSVDSDAERELFVDPYCVIVRDKLMPGGKLALTIKVRMATEEELVPKRGKWAYYLQNLESAQAEKRLMALEGLAEMISCKSMYAGSRSEFFAAIKPLADDADVRVGTKAMAYLNWPAEER